MLKWLGYAVLAFVAWCLLAALFGPGAKEQFQKSAPAYASAMTNDYSYNTCVVNTANRLRATRTDFLKMAEMACSVH